MKILTYGHRYELANHNLPDQPGQALQFIEKTAIVEGKPELRTVNDGTTNEEVLRVLIDRLRCMNDRFPCDENVTTITLLKAGLAMLEKRTADRKARNVEGTAQK